MESMNIEDAFAGSSAVQPLPPTSQSPATPGPQTPYRNLDGPGKKKYSANRVQGIDESRLGGFNLGNFD